MIHICITLHSHKISKTNAIANFQNETISFNNNKFNQNKVVSLDIAQNTVQTWIL
jgi:hypothetical protein